MARVRTTISPRPNGTRYSVDGPFRSPALKRRPIVIPSLRDGTAKPVVAVPSGRGEGARWYVRNDGFIASLQGAVFYGRPVPFTSICQPAESEALTMGTELYTLLMYKMSPV